MEKMRVGVIGVGNLGQHHARVYTEIPGVQLVGVADSDLSRAKEVAGRHRGAAFYQDYRNLLKEIQAVSIVVPTSRHYQVAMDCLQAGLHVLVEKPIAASEAQAEEMVRLAEARKLVLQVGHIERFNPAVRAAAGYISDPKFVEVIRIAPFGGRGTDVPVVLDLMIHDIDIILSFVGSDLERISAIGFALVSQKEDIANARLEFANGCVANVTASRISAKKERRIRLFQRQAYINIDYMKPEVKIYRLKGEPRGMLDLAKMVEYFEPKMDRVEPLRAELESFVRSVREGRGPLVSGRDGLRALRVAVRIMKAIEEHRRKL
jgi:predicted dehydrogenase